jgi:hypothetical protein
MKHLVLGGVVLLFLAGCGGMPGSDRYPLETQARLVSGCPLLGVVSETANADRLSATVARQEMIRTVKRRARELGGTHIVWLHRTDTAAAAQVYACPGQ